MKAEISERASGLYTKYMSPYCPGANLRDCTSGKAATLREEIHDWVAEGRDEAWIEARLIDEFGEQILSAPKFRGFNALVWLTELATGGALLAGSAYQIAPAWWRTFMIAVFAGAYALAWFLRGFWAEEG